MKVWTMVTLVVCAAIFAGLTACEKSATAITEVTFCSDTVAIHDTLVVHDTVTVTDTLVCEPQRGHSGNFVCEKKKHNDHDRDHK